MSVIRTYSGLRVAVIGCGNWGKNLIRVLHSLGVLVGICDAQAAKAAQFSEQFQVPALTLAQILEDTEIDAVVIATPSRTHFEIGVACLKANKHIYIEKPFAEHLSQAVSLHQLAKSHQRILMVGHLLQYHRAFNHIKQLKREGFLGELQYIHSNRFNFGKFPNENSVLMDFVPHDVSMILSLVETLPKSVMAMNANHFKHTQSDTVSIQLHFPANVKAHIFASWLYPYKEQKMIVVGSKAIIIFEDSQPWESKLRLCRYPELWQDGLPQPFAQHLENIPIDPAEPLLEECSHFLDCIQKNNTPITGAQEALNVMTVLDAATHSMKTEMPVSLPLELSKEADKYLDRVKLEEAL